MNDFFSELFEGADVLSTYTRADALRDGALVNLDPTLTREAGFLWPVDMTAAAYADAVRWGEQERMTNPTACQDETGRMMDVLSMCRVAMKAPSDAPAHIARPFLVWRVPGDRRTERLSRCQLMVQQAWTDDGRPTVLILCPGED